MPSPSDVTQLLIDLCAGKSEAQEQLIPLVYDELHNLADRYMRHQKPGHTLQATALVHEAYIRLGGDSKAAWESRAHFMCVAARAMRSVLVDHDRKRRTKSGGGRARQPLITAVEFSQDPSHDLIDLDEALIRLAEIDPQGSQVVELRFFGGLDVEETARIMKISTPTVKREWRAAKAWLKKEIAGKDQGDTQG